MTDPLPVAPQVRGPLADADASGHVDPRLFRRVMGTFATGVAVITVETDDAPRGMTANAFSSGSLEPPLCIVSVAKRAHTHGFLRRAGRFGVNILAQDQEHYARHFAGRPIPGLAVTFDSVDGIPLLADAIARMAARLEAEHDCGDHTIFVGRILAMDCDDRMPLLYHRGGFGALMPARDKDEVPVPEFW